MNCSFETDEIPVFEVGEDFIQSDLRVVVLDTLQITMSTVKLDSLVTSNPDRLLFGQYTDPYLGEMRCEPFMELIWKRTEVSSNARNYEIEADAVMDSVALILGYEGYFYNDTTRTLQLNVHRILEEVVPEDDEFYNTSKLKYDTLPITSLSFQPHPRGDDSLHVSLPRRFGLEIFQRIVDNEVNDDEELLEIFKGLTLQPGNNDHGSVIGFSMNPEKTFIRFYYSVPGEIEDQESFFDLALNPLPFAPSSFNRLSSDPSSTPLTGLTDQEMEVFSTDYNDLTFIQSGIGFATKINFPTLRSLKDISKRGTILSANIRLKPLESSLDLNTPARDSLSVLVLDLNHEIGQELRNGGGTVLGRIIGDDPEYQEIVFDIPVGIFLSGKMNEERDDGNSLLLLNKEINQTVDRVVFQGENHTDYRARVVITYGIYEE